MSGHDRPEQAVTFKRNGWSRWRGIRNTDQCSYLFSIERTEFWKLTEQGVGEDFADARHAGQDLRFDTPAVYLGDFPFDLSGDGFDLSLQYL